MAYGTGRAGKHGRARIRRMPKANFAARVLSVVRKAADSKFLTAQVVNFVAATTASQVFSLTAGIGPGTENNQRVGNKIRLTHLYFNINTNATFPIPVENADSLRYGVVYSRTPIATGFFPTVYQPINLNDMPQAMILLDELVGVNDANGGNPKSWVRINTEHHIRLHYTSQYETSGDTPQAGFLYFFFVGDTGSVTNGTSLQMSMRLSYNDV